MTSFLQYHTRISVSEERFTSFLLGQTRAGLISPMLIVIITLCLTTHFHHRENLNAADWFWELNIFSINALVIITQMCSNNIFEDTGLTEEWPNVKNIYQMSKYQLKYMIILQTYSLVLTDMSNELSGMSRERECHLHSWRGNKFNSEVIGI